ncbi:hypothetical protein [Dorea sp.]|uniref:DUF7657 domain-containing protein n=1 Tax=Dorea sp. TaxID=2040332 RepID=UPI0035287435
MSVVLSFLISFAPVVQWWFAINGLVEMLIFMQLSMVMVWKYMNTENSVQRIPYVVVIMICAGGYILTMYPAWQISLAYVLLGIFVWIIWENYKKFHIKNKRYTYYNYCSNIYNFDTGIDILEIKRDNPAFN